MADLHSLRVAVELPCLRCKYDLRGLHADGRCPECGLELVASIAARVDPELALLPPLPRPRVAGWSLLAVMLAATTAVFVAVLSYAALAITVLPHGSWRAKLSQLLPSTLAIRLVAVPPIALAVALVASVMLLRVTENRRSVRVGLAAGLVAWLAASCLPVSARAIALTGVPAAVTLLALSPILADLGRRSRTYRARPAGRQPIGPLESAIAVGVMSYAAAELLEPLVGHDATTALRLVAVACLAMTLIGFVYLLANALWVWRALASWQPVLERVMDHEPPAERPTGMPPLAAK